MSADRKPARRDVSWSVALGGVALGIAFTLGFACWFAFPGSLEKLVRRIPDDSIFYFQIALNFAETHRFTYDGLHDTYGFQPLWQLILACVAPLFDDRVHFLQAGVLLLGGIHAATGWLLFRLLLGPFGPVSGALAALVWLANPPLLYWSLAGKENPLYALLLVAILLHVQRRWLARPPTVRAPAGIALGVLAGLVFLARVNALLFLGLLGAALAIAAAIAPRTERPARIRALATAGLAASAVAGPWLVYAHHVFGGMLPTSGVMKLAISHTFVEVEWGVAWMSLAHFGRALGAWPAYVAARCREFGGDYAIAYAAFAALALPGGIRGRSLRRRTDLRAATAAFVPIALLFTWGAMNAFVNLLTLPSYVAYGLWYAVPEALCVPVALGILGHAAGLAARSERGRTRIAAGSVGLAVVLAGVGLAQSIRDDRGWTDVTTNERMLQLGLHVAHHFPEDVRFGAWDSGIFTYFSERTVVSLEGLVSERSFVESGRLDVPRYLRENGVSYVFGPGREFEDGSFQLAWMPRGTYDVEWLPFSAVRLWREGWSTSYALARLRDGDADPRLGPPLYSFGAVRPRTNETAPGPFEPASPPPAAGTRAPEAGEVANGLALGIGLAALRRARRKRDRTATGERTAP